MPLIDPRYFGSPFPEPPPPDGTEGTAIVKLTLKDKQEPMRLNGCFIPNDDNFKKLIKDDTYSGKHIETKFFIYFCCFYENLERNLIKTEINVHRFTKPDRDKHCTIHHGPDSAFFLHKDCHVFLPACHEVLKSRHFTRFLEKHSKIIPSQFHPIANDQYKGLTQVDGLVKFIEVTLTSRKERLVVDITSFNRVLNGPVLESNKIVGYCCKESDGSRITVHMLGTQNTTIVPIPMELPGNSSNSPNRTDQDVELYSFILKEAITEQTDLLPKEIAQSKLKTDDIFTNLTVFQGKQKSLQEKALEEKGQRTRKMVTEITEVFFDENDGKPKSSILVSGEAGIGKTLFSHKILRDWSKNGISISNIKFAYLITFRQLVLLGNKELTLRELLNRSPLLNERTMIDENVMDHVIQFPKHLFIILDGFDEYKDHNKILGAFQSQFPNDVKTKMPVAALISKIIQKKVLNDSIIMITSRPGQASKLDEKLHFDRCVEIIGFSESQIIQFVEKYFNSKPEEEKKSAVERVKGTTHYMSFGRVPLMCLFVCQVIEWEIKNKLNVTRNNLIPITLTQFYYEIISSLERSNREIDSLDEESASSAVDKTLDNLTKLAANLARDQFSFTQTDLENLKLPEDEMANLKSSNLIICYPIVSDSPFPQTTLEYGFAHLTIQEFFVARHLVKMNAMSTQESSEMVLRFMSGLLGLKRNNSHDRLMSGVLECVYKQEKDADRRRVVLLRFLYEFGQEKEFTRQELTANCGYRYWDRDGWIGLLDVTDMDCAPIAMLVDSIATSTPSPPETLYIAGSQLTSSGISSLLPSLIHPNCTITELRLSYCELDDEAVECLTQYLQPNTKITVLYLDGNQISDAGIQHIVSHLPSIVTLLELSNNNISDAGVQHIVTHLPSKVTDLVLLNNPVSDECKKSVKKFCKDNYPSLKLLI